MTQYRDWSDEDKQALAKRVADELQGDNISRRELLTMLGVVGVGSAVGGAGLDSAVGTVSAGTQQSGTIGTSTNPVDIEGEDITTDSLSVTNGITAGSIKPDEAVITGGRGFLGLPNHHINYDTGLSNEEIARFTVDGGQKLELWRLETKIKGDGTNANISVDVYDASNATVLGSTSDKITGSTSPVGTSGDGATITVRVSNSTGSTQAICITGITSIVKV